MTDKEKAALSYRFSGYQLPKIQLDETGHTYYYIVGVHPYYTTQPMYWQKPYYSTSTATIGDNGAYSPRSGSELSGIKSDSLPPTQTSKIKLYCMGKF